MMYEKDDKTCQPCDNFQPKDSYFGMERHSCPGCEGTRVFCENCYKDHHSNGWNSCTINTVCPFDHPACIGGHQ